MQIYKLKFENRNNNKDYVEYFISSSLNEEDLHKEIEKSKNIIYNIKEWYSYQDIIDNLIERNVIQFIYIKNITHKFY